MKRIYILILATLFGCMVAKSQQIEGVKPEVLMIADSLTGIFDPSDNRWCNIPEEILMQETFKQIASNDEFVVLAKTHHNAAIRAFSFQELLMRGDTRYKDILYNSLTDTATFQLTSSSVIVPYQSVADYNVAILTLPVFYMSDRDSIHYDSLFRSNPELIETKPNLYYNFINTPKMSDYRRTFSIQDSITLDSVLLYTPYINNVGYKFAVLNNLPLDDKYYNRLYEMYIQEGYIYALPALCRYRKDELKPFVKNYLQSYPYVNCTSDSVLSCHEISTKLYIGLLSVKAWPDSDFIPILTDIINFDYGNWINKLSTLRDIYSALITYDDEYTYRLIEKSLTAVKDQENTDLDLYYRKIAFRSACEKNPIPRYLPLVEKYCNTAARYEKNN